MALNLSPSPSVVTTQEDALAVVEELKEHIKVPTHHCMKVSIASGRVLALPS